MSYLANRDCDPMLKLSDISLPMLETLTKLSHTGHEKHMKDKKNAGLKDEKGEKGSMIPIIIIGTLPKHHSKIEKFTIHYAIILLVQFV